MIQWRKLGEAVECPIVDGCLQRCAGKSERANWSWIASSIVQSYLTTADAHPTVHPDAGGVGVHRVHIREIFKLEFTVRQFRYLLAEHLLSIVENVDK